MGAFHYLPSRTLTSVYEAYMLVPSPSSWRYRRVIRRPPLSRNQPARPWCSTFQLFREKRLSPRRASAAGGSLLPLSPRRTQVRLKPLLYQVSAIARVASAPAEASPAQE